MLSKKEVCTMMTKTQLEESLEKIRNSEHQTILKSYWLSDKSLDNLADSLYYSRATFYRRYRQAIAEFKQVNNL